MPQQIEVAHFWFILAASPSIQIKSKMRQMLRFLLYVNLSADSPDWIYNISTRNKYSQQQSLCTQEYECHEGGTKN